jgi:anti-anti-sigma factor
MEIRTRLEGEDMHVELEGRMDAAWSGTFGKTLQDTLLVGCHSVILDLGKVNYLSSAGIRILMLLAKQLKGIGGKLHISEQSPQVREVLEMVGFHRLIEPLPTATSPAGSRPSPLAEPVVLGEHTFEAYSLATDAVHEGQLIGQPLTTAGQCLIGDGSVWRLTPGRLALGLGSIGDERNPARAGELLGVEGLAINLPGDDPAHPDWLTREGDLVPAVRLHYGLTSEGHFRELLRFGNQPDTPALPLSELAGVVLERSGCDTAVWVTIAETASLVGAALQKPPDEPTDDWFGFPAIRQRMLFTAEPAHASETCLIVGIVVRQPAESLAGFLRPLSRTSDLHGHCHAAIVPYRPVKKGCIEQADMLESLLESQTIRGVLHLLHDDRDGVGAGESHLRRGAVWWAPLRFTATEAQA